MKPRMTKYERQFLYDERSECPICHQKTAVLDKLGWLSFCENEDNHTPEQIEQWKQSDNYKYTYGQYE